MAMKVHTGQGDGHSPGSYYRAPKDAVVDPENEESVAYWARALELTTADLRAAIKSYGTCNVRLLRRALTEANAQKSA